MKHTIGDYRLEIDGNAVYIESSNPRTKLDGLRDDAIIYENGGIAYTYPELVPEYVKREIEWLKETYRHCFFCKDSYEVAAELNGLHTVCGDCTPKLREQEELLHTAKLSY